VGLKLVPVDRDPVLLTVLVTLLGISSDRSGQQLAPMIGSENTPGVFAGSCTLVQRFAGWKPPSSPHRDHERPRFYASFSRISPLSTVAALCTHSPFHTLRAREAAVRAAIGRGRGDGGAIPSPSPP
jgi:hypothetical protein